MRKIKPHTINDPIEESKLLNVVIQALINNRSIKLSIKKICETIKQNYQMVWRMRRAHVRPEFAAHFHPSQIGKVIQLIFDAYPRLSIYQLATNELRVKINKPRQKPHPLYVKMKKELEDEER
jgi:hypothetical protein